MARGIRCRTPRSEGLWRSGNSHSPAADKCRVYLFRSGKPVRNLQQIEPDLLSRDEFGPGEQQRMRVRPFGKQRSLRRVAELNSSLLKEVVDSLAWRARRTILPMKSLP